jgi:hypothetical protein
VPITAIDQNGLSFEVKLIDSSGATLRDKGGNVYVDAYLATTRVPDTDSDAYLFADEEDEGDVVAVSKIEYHAAMGDAVPLRHFFGFTLWTDGEITDHEGNRTEASDEAARVVMLNRGDADAKGWDLFDTGARLEVERDDDLALFDDDLEALAAAVRFFDAHAKPRTTIVHIELAIEGDPDDAIGVVERVLDSGFLQDGINDHEYDTHGKVRVASASARRGDVS